MINIFHIIQVFLRMFSCSRIFGWGEGGENFAGVVRRINPLIDSVLGQVDDIMVDNNYQRVKKRLDEFEGQRQSLVRKNMLDMRYNDALMQLQSNPDALYKDKVFLDKTSPAFQQHEAFTRYNNYKAMQDPNALGPDGKPVAPMSIDDFINSDNVPSTVKEDLIAKGLLQQSKVQLDDNELQNLITTTAGLSAEDIAFRNEMNAKNLSAADYNRAVRNYVMESQGDLTSRGRLADSLFKRTAGIGQDLQIAPDKIDYKTVDGKLLRVNETTGKVETTYEGEANVTPFSKEARVVQNPDGTFSKEIDFVDKKGNLKTKKYNATQDEYEIYRTTVENKTFSAQEKMQQSLDNKKDFYGYRISTGGTGKKKSGGTVINQLDDVQKKGLSDIKSWGLSGSKWATMNDLEKQEYIDKEKELAKLYTNGDIKKLQEVKENIIKSKGKNSDEKAYLEYLNNGAGEDTPQQDSFPSTPNTGKIIDKVKAKAFGTAVENFQNFIENDKYAYDQKGKKVGNYNISPSDWARELSYQPFIKELDEITMELLVDWFKRKTGKELNKYLKFD